MTSLCSRVDCSQPALCWLIIDPRECRAWLADMGDSSVLGVMPLCGQHALTRTVPLGWEFADERTPEGIATAELALVIVGDGAADAVADGADAGHDAAVGRSEAEPEDDPVALSVVADEIEAESRAVNRPGPAVEAPTLWPTEDDPEGEAAALEVDESTPLLSRAFRAAHVE